MSLEQNRGMEDYTNWTAPGSPDIKKIQEDRERQLMAKGWERFHEDVDYRGPARIPDRRNTYNKINNVMCIVNSQGEKYVKPWDSKLEHEVRNAGFELNESLGVPYANGFPEDPNIRKRWQELWDRHNAEARIEASENERHSSEKSAAN